VNALTVSHHIAAPLEVIPEELGTGARNLAIASKALIIADAATFEVGNRLLIDSHAALKQIEAKRVALKRPLADLGKAIESVCSSLSDPLEKEKANLQGRVAAWSRQEKAKAEAARLAAEEVARKEREAAEQERARLQAIADEEHRQQVAAAEAKAKAEADELAAVLGKPVEAKPVEVAPAPKVEIAAPTTPAPVIPAAPKASAIVERNVPVLVIDDAALVPVSIGGQELRPLDKAAIKRAINAGITVPGAHIEMQPQTAMARQP
jgi:flagellar biosynthesis GTPase FlhF